MRPPPDQGVGRAGHDLMGIHITIAAGGTIETALLPYHLVHLRAHYDALHLHVALSKEAQGFVTTLALRSITGSDVYIQNNQFDNAGRPFHLSLSDHALLIIYPATPRVLCEVATGSISCCVTRLFGFTPKDRIIIAPKIHPKLTRSLYDSHIQKIQELGCFVLHPDTLWTPWADVELAIERKLLLQRTPPQQQIVQLNHLEANV